MSDWTIDDSFRFHEGERDGEHGRSGYTWDEFMSKSRPPCPKCGVPITVAPVDASSKLADVKLYIPGRVSCPNGCQPTR